MRVVVADSAPLLRAVLTGAFDVEPAGDIEVVATVSSLAELRSACRQFTPRVVVAGIAFRDGALTDVLAELLLGGCRVLTVCDVSQHEAAFLALFAGASGCLFVQDAGPSEVVAASRDVAAGNAALHPAAAAAVLKHWRDTRTDQPAPQLESAAPASLLTPREAEVLGALARGLPTKAIARELIVSPKTVEAHIARLLAKLGARNRAQAVSIAMDRGLVTPGTELLGTTPPTQR